MANRMGIFSIIGCLVSGVLVVYIHDSYDMRAACLAATIFVFASIPYEL